MSTGIVRLADVTTRIGSGITPRGGSSMYKSSGRPFVRSQNVGRGDLRLDDLAFIDEPTHLSFAASEIREGDVLLNITGASIGRSAVATSELDGGNVNQHVCEIRVDQRRMDPHYVNAVLSSRIGQSQIETFQAGGNRQGLNYRQVGSIQIPDIEPSQQVRIALALASADGLIDSLKRLIAKKRDIKQGMMQELLTGRTRLPGFTGMWERLQVREIVSTPVTDGPHSTPMFLDDGIPFLSVNNLVNGKIDWSDLRYISQEDHGLFSRKCHPRRGDVLIGKAASVGRVAFVDTDCDFNIWSPIAMIRVSSLQSARFVAYQLQSEMTRQQVEILTNTSSQGNIGMGDIERIELDLPPLREQEAIAGSLIDVDAEITVLEQRLESARAIKAGMMQELLTGRTRLVSEEAA